jgi:hypothetical protein
MQRPPLPPGNVPGTRFHQGLSRPQGRGTVGRNMSLKNPVTPPGIDPCTVRLVEQRLNHYSTTSPIYHNVCLFVCLFVFLTLQPILFVLSQPGGGL